MRKYLLAAIGVIGLGLATAAQAAPTLGFRVYDDNNLVGGLSTTSTNGALFANGATPNFLVSATANGAPLLAEPTLIAQTTVISAAEGFTGTHTIQIEYTQTDLSSAKAGGLLAQLASTFTANFLPNQGSLTSVTLTSYVDNNNGAFARTTQIGTQTYTSGPTDASPRIVTSVPLTNALFSETVVITATFTQGSTPLQTSAQIIAVPEPASLALLGSALLGLGFVRGARRRK